MENNKAPDLHPGYLRQRRNMLISSSVLILVLLSKKITAIPFLGFKFDLYGGEAMVIFILLIGNLYLIIRAKTYSLTGLELLAYEREPWFLATFEVEKEGVYERPIDNLGGTKFFRQIHYALAVLDEVLVYREIFYEDGPVVKKVGIVSYADCRELAYDGWWGNLGFKRYPTDYILPFVFARWIFIFGALKLLWMLAEKIQWAGVS